MVQNMNMNQLLTKIVEQTGGDLHSIIIVNLQDGLPLYSSRQDSTLYYKLFGDNDIGEALQDFNNLKQVQKALDSFGEATNSGDLKYSLFKLTNAQVMVYFHKLSDTTVAICFFALMDVLLGTLIFNGTKNIDQITNKISS